jgi:D-Tyr-tRNAtyr deacylase
MGDSSKVKDGKFGAKMDVELSNDGPVTMQIEYPGAAYIYT